MERYQDEGFVDEPNSIWVRGLYDYQGSDTSALSFRKGAIIEVFNQLETGWWDGVLNDERGWFPSNYVQTLTASETAAHLASLYETAVHESSQHNGWETDDSGWSGAHPRSDSSPHVAAARPQSMADDFWMPQFSADGQIYYLNSKTGETSRDIPSGSASVVDSAIELNDPVSRQSGYGSAYDILRGRTNSSARANPDVPSNWVKTLADDGISHYWFNTVTRETQWVEPTAPSTSSKTLAKTSTSTHDEFESDDAGYQALRKGFSNDVYSHSDLLPESLLRRTSVYTDASEAPSLSEATNITHFLSNNPGNSTASIPQSQEALAETNAKDLQYQLAPKASETFNDLAVLVKQAINEIVASPPANGNDPSEAALVMDRVSAVVVAVRNLLYTSGTLAAPLSSLLPQTAEAAESSRSPMLELRPYQRKVTATLSKLVLSARATKSHGTGRAPGANGTFDTRVDLDALELDRAIMVLVSEIQRASIYGRVKRLHAAFDSPDGVGGVGLGNPGGGLGGNLKALGFVPGDDMVDRLVLGRNLTEELDGFRLKVEASLRPLEDPDTKGTTILQDHGPLAVTELSALLGFVEDIDVGSVVDVTGTRGSGDEYVASVKEAQSLLRHLEWSKQAIFDEGMMLLMLCEGEREVHPYRRSPSSSSTTSSSDPVVSRKKAASFSRSIRAHIGSIQNVVDLLVGVAERQAQSRRGTAPMQRSGLGFHTGNASSDALNGGNMDQSMRDSMILPGFGTAVVERPDSPIRLAEDTQAAARQLESMAMDVPRGDSPDGEFVDFEDAFSAPRRPMPQSMPLTNGALAASMSARERLAPIIEPPSTTSAPAASTPYRSGRAAPMVDSDDEDLKITTKLTPRRGASNKLFKLLGEEAPADREKPWYLQPGYSDKELLFTAEGDIRGGTLPALVERLTYHYAADTAFNEAFLITFRSFTTPVELIDQLVTRFEKEPPAGLNDEELEDWKRNWRDPVRGRTINTLRRLLIEEDCITLEDHEALEKLRAFVKRHEAEGGAGAGAGGVKMVASTLQTLLSTGSAPTRKLSKTVPVGAPPPIVPKQNPSKKIKFLDMDPLEVARQLTLMESELFCKIRGPECLARAEGGQTDNDNIKAVILMSNKIADWVNEAILAKEDPRKRGLLIKHFIQIADKCRVMNNFSTMAALVAALNSPPIRRLKRSWDQVNKRWIEVLDDIENLMQAGKSLPDYRAMLSKVTLPCIPFIGVYLTTLTFIQDGMKDTLAKENNVINFLKRSKASAIITEIKKYQSAPYNFVSVEIIRAFLQEALRVERPQDFYWELSLQREPRERDDEKMARLLQESGFL